MRKIHYKKVKMLMYSMIEFSRGKKKIESSYRITIKGKCLRPSAEQLLG